MHDTWPCAQGTGQGLGKWAARLGYYVYETLGRARIAQLFDALVRHALQSCRTLC